ncbi:MAG: hypothetical protein ACRCTY_06700, partial [Candidatus Adiutrix sp.]
MGKKRIHELAKELSLSTGDLIQKIIELKLLPGVKLVAASGLEDYMVEEISRRLNDKSNPDVASLGSPQVVRRRKKSALDGAGETNAPDDELLAKDDD